MLSFIVNSSVILYQNLQYNFHIIKFIKSSFDYIDSIKSPQNKIYLMVRPDNENTITADETIIPHLEEAYGKENIIYVPFDENKINSKEFFPIQYVNIIYLPCYFYKIEN